MLREIHSALARITVTCLVGVLLPTASLAESTFPRLANLYLHGAVHTEKIEQLARWDLLVLSTAWTEVDLIRLRAANPNIQILLYVNPYSVRWPAGSSDAWLAENAAYAADHDLWWYDRDGNPASDWPGSRMVNVTALGASGPQGSWREFITQRITDLAVSRPSLDGIMLDNFWRRLSWNQDALQLDSDCNPTHNAPGCDGTADADSALDARWNAALSQLASDVRQRLDAIGASRGRPFTLVGNGATDYHTWINGSVHEFFPSGWSSIDYGNPYDYNWKAEMLSAEGGYLAAPFSTVPQRADILNATYAGTTDQPSRTPDFERHKRFTFVSALLGDGYYSLDADTQGGHGSLWWEPEYDHAGRGDGYLGRALGPAKRQVVVTGPEVVSNGDFSDDLQGWVWHPSSVTGAVHADAAVYRSAPTSARFSVQSVQPEGGELKAWHTDLPLQQDRSYTLTLWTRADRDMSLAVELYSSDCAKSLCMRTQNVQATGEWEQHVFSFVASVNTPASLNVFVREPGSVWLDDVSLRQGSGDVFRRDFENGIVLLNYTPEPQTLALGGAFTRLDIPGSDVFDGTRVESETVPSWDGRVLLRPANLPPTPSRSGRLFPNEPNPFNPATRIRFALDEPQHVRVAIFDLRGRLVAELHDGMLPASEDHTLTWDGTDRRGRPVRSGIYVYRLIGEGFGRARKMTLLR